jgi:predicted transcriptional regulator
MTASSRTHAALLAARLAHQRRTESVDDYRRAIADATRAGCTYTEIASVLGITRQAIRQYTLTN